ncbi:hypothetical protein ACWDHW_13125 [Streptomyces melanosporofaciens]
MGFHFKPKNIQLVFDDTTDYAGFECVVRGMNLGEYMEILRLDEVTTGVLDSQVRRFAESLVSWNLEDPETGEPIPATADEVFRQDMDFMLHVAGKWMDAIHGVSAPLEQTSPDGEPSVAASIPMATLSESLAS